MPKFIVTLVTYTDVIIEAENVEHAQDVACSLTEGEWGSPSDSDLHIEPYEGNKPAVNEESKDETQD